MRRITPLLLVVMPFCAAGDTYAAHENLGCSDCHASHRSEAPSSGVPLWSSRRPLEAITTFALYRSRTFDSLRTDITQPDGASKLCLGCHDGSYDSGSDSFSRSKIGPLDLAKAHPISFTYNNSLTRRVRSGSLKDPSAMSGLGGTIAQDLLDDNGKLQCTSCHEVHAGGKGQHLLRFEYNPRNRSTAAFCRVCHNK